MSASCTLARAASLQNLRESVAASSNVSSMWAMCRLSPPVATVQAELVDQAVALFCQGDPQGVDLQAAPRRF